MFSLGAPASSEAVERENLKERRERWEGKKKGRDREKPFLSSHRPLRAYLYVCHFYFIGIPNGSL